MNIRSSIRHVVFLSLLINGCGGISENEDSLVTVQTKLGDIKLILYNATPLHKASFLELANQGAYDSTRFHRVIKGFMIQAGDVGTRPEFKKLSSKRIPEEISNTIIHKRGALGAARDGDNINPNRSSSIQFYIVQGKKFSKEELTTDIASLNVALSRYLINKGQEEILKEFVALQDSGKIEEMQKRALELRQEIEAKQGKSFEKKGISQNQINTYTTIGGAPHLDGNYTVFGEVVEGMDVVDKIAAIKTDSTDNPVDAIYIKMKVEVLSKEELSNRYGLKYPKKSDE